MLLLAGVFWVGTEQCSVPTGQALAAQQNPCPPECVIDSMEIVTWYPSPYNEYEELRLYPKRSYEESQCNSFEQLGLMYYNQDEHTLKICQQDPATLNYSWQELGGGFWQAATNPNNIYYNSGNVGIGTTGPGSQLHLSKSTNDYLTLETTGAPFMSGYWVRFLRSGVPKKFIGIGGTDDLDIFQGDGSNNSAANRMFIRMLNSTGDTYFGGNVGIGTTNPGTRLHIIKDAAGDSNTYNEILRLDSSNPSDPNPYITVGGRTSGGGGTLVYQKGGAGGGKWHLWHHTESNPVITAQQNGNVGIGTMAPMAKLSVISNIRNSSTPGDESNSFVQDVVILTTGVTSWQTLRTLTYAPIPNVWTRGIVEAEVVGHTGGPPAIPGNGNGLIISKWYFDIFNGALTVGIIGTDTTSGPGSPQFRLSRNGKTILIQVQSGNGASVFTGTTYLRVIIPRTAGSSADFTIN